MSHMYIMAYEDMVRSDSTIFRSIRAMYHATYLSKCVMVKMVESDRNMPS